MENRINEQQLEQFKNAKTPEEMLALAKENGIDIPDEVVHQYFKAKSGSGELSDDELDSIAGGGSHDDETGGLVTFEAYACGYFDRKSGIQKFSDAAIIACHLCKYWRKEYVIFGICTHPGNGYRT